MTFTFQSKRCVLFVWLLLASRQRRTYQRLLYSTPPPLFIISKSSVFQPFRPALFVLKFDGGARRRCVLPVVSGSPGCPIILISPSTLCCRGDCLGRIRHCFPDTQASHPKPLIGRHNPPPPSFTKPSLPCLWNTPRSTASPPPRTGGLDKGPLAASRLSYENRNLECNRFRASFE